MMLPQNAERSRRTDVVQVLAISSTTLIVSLKLNERSITCKHLKFMYTNLQNLVFRTNTLCFLLKSLKYNIFYLDNTVEISYSYDYEKVANTWSTVWWT